MMCVPMFRDGDVCQGVVQLDSRDKANLFQQDDLDLLVCTSLFASRAVEVARSHEARRAMEAAIQIQRSFLPEGRPECRGLEFFDHYSPAADIGGDYYDYILLPDNRVAVAIGDVAGKDLSAALLMARLSAAVRVCLTSSTDVVGAVRQLNVLLTRAGGEDRFITFAVAVVDLDRSLVTIVNAGHLPPLLRRADQFVVEEVDSHRAGLPLGVMDQQYEAVQIQFHPGDALLLYTDGVSEMRDSAGEMYGVARICDAMRSAPMGAVPLERRFSRMSAATPAKDPQATISPSSVLFAPVDDAPVSRHDVLMAMPAVRSKSALPVEPVRFRHGRMENGVHAHQPRRRGVATVVGSDGPSLTFGAVFSTRPIR